MAALMGRMFNRCIPALEIEADPICRKEDLTNYEISLQKALARFALLVLMCFLMNAGLLIYEYETGGDNQGKSDFALSFITLIPMIPQFVLSMRFRFTSVGRTLHDLAWFRVALVFFLLMNLTRLFTRVSLDGWLCKLSDEAFESLSDKPNTTRCSSLFQGLSTVVLLMYVMFTLLQIVCVQKIELALRRRNLREYVA
eukprot:CAMPEP_0118635610 /NCGR_PEP_ID=MMETSP0785-20121206/2166_1 /TAXON_ID=91992 /ORGANISM="Bolidomonas pacifica, Strain CCMP 1866" /LENGTH=197 /DNA_ID=CAMNT_0006526651 /DNA_START=85 /DNA_END=674 /DNA_ORIENTATION=-